MKLNSRILTSTSILFAYCLGAAKSEDVVCASGQESTVSFNESDVVYISTTNFPNYYWTYMTSCVVKALPEVGFGVVAVFEQFYIDPQEVLKIYTTSGNTSRSGGTTDPETRTAAFASSEGELAISFQSSPPYSISIPYSGFRIIAKTYKLALGIGAACNEERNLKDTYFVISPGYPNDYGANRVCSWKFTSDSNIRIVFFNFRSDPVSGDVFIINATDSNGKHSTQPLQGDLTADLAVPFYFGSEVQISFLSSATNQTSPQRRFLFVIDSYATPVVSNDCAGVGTHDMTVETSVNFSSPGYGLSAYPNNLQCNFSFTNPPPLHQIYMELYFETERCCDTMQVEGIGQDYVFQGQRDPSLYLANDYNLPVSLYYSSDSVRTASGFKGSVSTLDCGCQNLTINVPEDGSGKYTLESPGFGKSPTYCFNLECEWSFTFGVNLTLRISSNHVDLRSGDVVQITAGGETIANLTGSARSNSAKFLGSTSTGSLTVTFNSTASHNPYAKLTNVAAGFSILVTSVPVIYTASYYVSLTNTNFIWPFERMTQPGENFLWTVQARSNQTVTLYVYDSVEISGIELNVFDGPTVRSPLISTSLLNASTAIVSGVRSNGSSLTFRFINTNISSFHLSGLVTDIADAAYENSCQASLVVRFTNSLTMDLPHPVDDNATCFLVFHSTEQRVDLRSGIDLSLTSENFGRTHIFKGSIPTSDMLLATSPPYSFFVFDDSVAVSYSSYPRERANEYDEFPLTDELSTDGESLRTSQQPSEPIFTIALRRRTILRNSEEPPITNDSIGYLFSPDYLSTNDIGKTYQRYLLTLDSEDASGFKVDVVNEVNGYQISLLADRDGQSVYSNEILTGKPSLQVCASSLVVIYRSNGGTGKGMFVKYWKSFDDICETPSSGAGKRLVSSSVAISVFHVMIFFNLIQTYVCL